MKNRKKLTAVTAFAVVAAMAMPTFASASTVSLNDISGSYAQAAIQALADQGIVSGYNGNFNPTQNISRQDFAIILAKSLGLSQVTGTSSFTDVSGYAAGWVEAVYKAGLTAGVGNGMFGAHENITRQDMVVMFAKGLKAAGYDITGKGQNLKFDDASDIAPYAKDAVGAAVELGFISGNGNLFQPTANADRQAVASVAYKYLNAVAQVKVSGNFKLTASATNVSIGQNVQFSVTGAKDPVVWSVDKNGVIDQSGNFVASATGTATVTAMVDGKTLTQAVTVYGTVSSVKIVVPTSLVANNKSTQNVTVNAVDANGNVVTNFSGTAHISYSSIGGATQFADSNGNAIGTGTQTITFTNGVATVSVIGNQTPGLTDTLSVDTVTPTGAASALSSVYATANISTVAQVATSIKVTAPSSIGVNNGTEQKSVTAQVVDQSGNPMLTGVYPVTFHISGSSATFYVSNAATTTDQTATIVNNGTASVTLQSVKGVTGASTVTVTSGTLTGSATVNAAVVGNATKLGLAVDSTSSNSFVQTSGSTLFDISTQDAAGNTTTTALPSTVVVKVTNADGTAATNLKVNSTNVVDTNGVALAPGATTFTVSGITGKAAAGTYNVQVVDTATSGALVSPAMQQITITPDVANKFTTTAANSYISASNPTTTVSVQVTDVNGNAVAKSGIPVVFYAVRTGATGSASLNGVTQDGTSTSNTVTVNTDANGVAKVTLTPQSYTAAWTVNASTGSALASNTGSATVNVAPMVTGKLGVSITTVGGTYGGSKTTANAGDALTIAVTQQDQYGNTLPVGENDTVKVTFAPASGLQGLLAASTSAVTVTSNTASNTVTYQGTVNDINTALAGVTAGHSGAVTVSASDVSIPTATAGSATTNVLAQTLASKVKVLTPNNDSNSYTVATAGEVGPFTVQLVDAGGNPAVSSSDVYVSTSEINSLLQGTGATGVVSGTVRTSVNGTDSGSVKIPAGTTQVQVWVNVSTSGVLVPTAAASLATVLPAAPSVTNITANQVFGTAGVTPTFSAAPSGDTQKYTLDGATYTSGTAVTSAGSHTLVATNTDAAGNTASASVTFTVDKTAPTTPGAQTVVADATNGLDVSWTASTDADNAVAGYNVYYSTSATGTFTKANTTPVVGTSFNITDGTPGLTANTAYYVYVTAVDAAGNETAAPSPVTATATAK